MKFLGKIWGLCTLPFLYCFLSLNDGNTSTELLSTVFFFIMLLVIIVTLQVLLKYLLGDCLPHDMTS